MARLSNVRHELFATYLSQGKSQLESYELAGFNTNGQTSNACTLARRPEIQARIAELIDERVARQTGVSVNADLEHQQAINTALETGEIDRGWIIMMLMENTRLAREAGQFAASNKCLELLGREIGMFQEGNARDREKAAAEKQIEAEKRQNSIPVDKVNALLERLGYAGPPIDTEILTPVPPPEKKKRGRQRADNAE